MDVAEIAASMSYCSTIDAITPLATGSRGPANLPGSVPLKCTVDGAITNPIMVDFSSDSLASPADFGAHRMPGALSAEVSHHDPRFFPGPSQCGPDIPSLLPLQRPTTFPTGPSNKESAHV